MILMNATPIRAQTLQSSQPPSSASPTKHVKPELIINNAERKSTPRALNMEERVSYLAWSPLLAAGALLVSPISIGCALVSLVIYSTHLDDVQSAKRAPNPGSQKVLLNVAKESREHAKHYYDLAVLPFELAFGALDSALSGNNFSMPERLGKVWE